MCDIGQIWSWCSSGITHQSMLQRICTMHMDVAIWTSQQPAIHVWNDKSMRRGVQLQSILSSLTVNHNGQMLVDYWWINAVRNVFSHPWFAPYLIRFSDVPDRATLSSRSSTLPQGSPSMIVLLNENNSASSLIISGTCQPNYLHSWPKLRSGCLEYWRSWPALKLMTQKNSRCWEQKADHPLEPGIRRQNVFVYTFDQSSFWLVVCGLSVPILFTSQMHDDGPWQTYDSLLHEPAQAVLWGLFSFFLRGVGVVLILVLVDCHWMRVRSIHAWFLSRENPVCYTFNPRRWNDFSGHLDELEENRWPYPISTHRASRLICLHFSDSWFARPVPHTSASTLGLPVHTPLHSNFSPCGRSCW